MVDEFLEWLLRSTSAFAGPVETTKIVRDVVFDTETVWDLQGFLHYVKLDWEPRLGLVAEAHEAHAKTVGCGGTSVVLLALLLRSGAAAESAAGALAPARDVVCAADAALQAAAARLEGLAERHVGFSADSFRRAFAGGSEEDAMRRLLGLRATCAWAAPTQALALRTVAQVPAAAHGGAIDVVSPDLHAELCTAPPMAAQYVADCVVVEAHRPRAVPLHKAPPEYPLGADLKTLFLGSIRSLPTTTQGGKLDVETVITSEEGLYEAHRRGAAPDEAEVCNELRRIVRETGVQCVIVGEVDVDAWAVWETCVELGVSVVAELSAGDVAKIAKRLGVYPGLGIFPGGGSAATAYAPHIHRLNVSVLSPFVPHVYCIRRARSGDDTVSDSADDCSDDDDAFGAVSGGSARAGAVFVCAPAKETQGRLRSHVQRAVRRRAALLAPGGLALPGGGFFEAAIAGMAEEAARQPSLSAVERSGRALLRRVLSEYLVSVLCNQGVLRSAAVDSVSEYIRGVGVWLRACEDHALLALAGVGGTRGTHYGLSCGYPPTPLEEAAVCGEAATGEAWVPRDPTANVAAADLRHWEPLSTRVAVLQHALMLATTLCSTTIVQA